MDSTSASKIFALDSDRFLIFRPRDYHHVPHVHPKRYHFTVIKGLIEVQLGGRKMIARPERKVTLEPGLTCETWARENTWLLVEPADSAPRARRRTRAKRGVSARRSRRRR